MTGREDWMTQAIFTKRATSQNVKSSSSVELFPPFVRFPRETPRPGDGICRNTSSDTLPCTKQVITCRPSHDGKTAELVHYCSDFRWLLILVLGISIKAFLINAGYVSA
jgi:hypothetical protein